MTDSRVPEHISLLMADKARSGNLRHIPAGAGDRRTMLDLVSNDYLSLGSRADAGEFDELKAKMCASHAMTSSASRLLSRRQGEYAELESLLETLYGRPLVS